MPLTCAFDHLPRHDHLKDVPRRHRGRPGEDAALLGFGEDALEQGDERVEGAGGVRPAGR